METVNYGSIWCVIVLSYEVQNQRIEMSSVILEGTEALNSHRQVKLNFFPPQDH